MRYEVILRYFQDVDTGTYGLAPVDTINSDTSFNAFWGADGIFHDVFEHYFEGILPYYSREGFMTLWGEMAASGHAIAYAELGINNFRYRSNSYRDYTLDTMGYLKDAVCGAAQYRDQPPYLHFDSLKETCLCPYQRPVNHSTFSIDSTIEDYLETLKEYAKTKEIKLDDIVWIPGIARNYRYGYKVAQRIIGKDVNHSYTVLDDFLTQWNEICKKDAESLMIEDSDYGFYGVKFVIQNTGKLSVEATLLDDVRQEFPLDALIFY